MVQTAVFELVRASALNSNNMVLGRFTIFLDNPDATYFPGQEITGNIHIWSESPRNVKGIHFVNKRFEMN